MNHDHQWSVRISGIDKDRNAVFARRSQFEIGSPISFDKEYRQTTAIEHLLAAVGSDVVSGLLIRAKRRRIEIDNVEATVECTLDNALTFLEVVGEAGSPRINLLRVMAYISTFASESELEEIWQTTLSRSPMIQTLKDATELELSYKIVL